MRQVTLDKATLDYAISLSASQHPMTALVGLWRVMLNPGEFDDATAIDPTEYKLPIEQAHEILSAARDGLHANLLWLNHGPGSWKT